MSNTVLQKEITEDPPAPAPGPHRPRPLSLRHNFLWSVLGVAIFGATNWAMQIVLVKLGTSAIVGQYALGVAVAQPLVVFAQLNLRNVQATDVRHQFRFRDYLGLRLLCLAVVLLVIGGLSFGGGHDPVTALVIFIIGLGMVIDSVSDVIYGLLQQHERMDRIGISMSIKGFLSLALLTAAFALTHSVLWAVAGSTLASLLVVLAYDIPTCRAFSRTWRHEEAPLPAPPDLAVTLRTWGRLAWLSLPLGGVLLLNALNTNVARFFIDHDLGKGALGIYAAMASLLVIGQMLILAIGQAASPRLAQMYARDDRRAFGRLLLKLAGMSSLVGLAALGLCAGFGRQILTLLFKAEYAQQLNVFLWLLAAGAVFYVSLSLGAGLTAARRFNIQVPWLTVVVAIAALTSWWLIPHYGLLGAALSTFIAMTVRLLIGLLLVVRLLRAPRALPARS